MTEPRYTPLRERHEALGASFTDFGGWMMPVRYSSDLAEHHAVRTAAGLFDVSHMAEFLVTGPHAGEFLDEALAGRLSALPLWKAKYSLMLAADGGILDDVIVYRLAEDRFLIISNAGNHDVVATAIAERAAAFDAATRERLRSQPQFAFVNAPVVLVEDVSEAFALIALQGPRAHAVLGAVTGLDDLATPLDDLGYYAATEATFDGAPLLIARTGYTGEDGFELLVAADAAGELWDAVLEAGAESGLVPAGLAARDTLRLEAGMPLHGHELSVDIAPAQAGLGRVVKTGDDDFVGKAGLAARPGDTPVLVGLVSEGRRAGRAGYAVLDADGTPVGEITSGALSPTLGHPIAMAFVAPAASAVGTELAIDVRGTRIPATVTALPFYRRKK
jgi:aminomethyltransferase